MKIIAHPAEGDPVVLGDDSLGDKISGDLPVQDRVVQAGPRFRAPFQKPRARANRLNSRTWQTDRQHDSEAIATKFKCEHADLVPLTADIQFEDTFGVRWLQDAVISRVACVFHVGRSTTFQYSIQGGEYLTTLE